MQGVENIQTVSDALSRMLHLNLDARKFISIAEEENIYRIIWISSSIDMSGN